MGCLAAWGYRHALQGCAACVCWISLAASSRQLPTTPPLHSAPLGPSLAPAGGSGARTLVIPGSPPHRPRHLPRLCSLRAAAGIRWVPPSAAAPPAVLCCCRSFRCLAVCTHQRTAIGRIWLARRGASTSNPPPFHLSHVPYLSLPNCLRSFLAPQAAQTRWWQSMAWSLLQAPARCRPPRHGGRPPAPAPLTRCRCRPRWPTLKCCEQPTD